MEPYKTFGPGEFDSSYRTKQMTLNRYMSRTYAWMFLGLMITFVFSWFLAASGVVYRVYAVPGLMFLLPIVEVVLVIVLSARLFKQSVNMSRGLFLVYSLLNGLVFATYFVVYGVANIILIFGLTALFFGGFALYGRFARTDLSRIQPFLFAGLLFLLVSMFITFLFNLTGLERVLCMAGIAIFLCFAAYDTQKLKKNYQYFSQDTDMLERASIYSALQLYLDFINLFLYMLRFIGLSTRRD